MTEASLGLRISSAPADTAAAALDKFVAAATRADAANNRLSSSDRDAAAGMTLLAAEMRASTAAITSLVQGLASLSGVQNSLSASAQKAAAGEGALAAAHDKAEASTASLTASGSGLEKVLTGLHAAITANTAAVTASSTASLKAAAGNDNLAASARRAAAAEQALTTSSANAAATETRLGQARTASGRSSSGVAQGPAGFAGLQAMGRANLETIESNKKLTAGLVAAGVAAEATGNKIKRAGLTAQEGKMIAIQAPDIIQGVLGGQSIGQIGIQQGGQIAQSLQMGEGGLTGGLGRAATSLGRIFTLGRVAFAGIAGGIILAGIELAKFQSQQDRLTDSLQLRGRASGLTTGGLNSLALGGAAAGGISNSSGRDLAAKYAGAGLQAPTIQGLIADTKAFARITGDSLGDAGDNLAKMFAKPVEGAKQLAESFGGISAATVDMIAHLNDSGQTIEAQAMLLKAFDGRLKEVKDTTWTLKLVWDELTTSLKNKADSGLAAAQRILAPSLEDQLAKARRTANAPGGFASIITGPTTEQRAAAAQRADDISTQLEKRDRTLQAQAARDLAEKQAGNAIEVVKSTVPEQERFRALQEAIKKLKDGLAGGGSLGMSADQAKEALARLEAAQRSLADSSGKMLLDSDMATEKFNIEIAAINARTLAEKEAVAQMRIESELRGQRIGDIDRQIAKDREAAKSAAQAARESRDQLRNSGDTAASAGLLSYQRAQQDITVKFRELRVSQGTSNALDQAETLERQAAAYTAIVGPLRDSNMAINAQIRLLEVQRDTFGQETDVVEAAGEKAKLWNSYIAAGINPAKTMVDAHTSLAKAIDMEAQKYGAAQLAAEKLAQAQGQVKQTVEDAKGAIGDMLDVISDDFIGGKGGNIFKDLAKTLGGDLLKSSLGSLKTQINTLVEKPLTSYLNKLSGADKLAVPDKLATALGERGASIANPVFVSVVGGLPGAGGLGGGAGGLLPGLVPSGAAGAGGLPAAAGGAAIAMTAAERDLMIRTLAGEAGGESETGQIAVASVIKNRLAAGTYGKDLTSVIKAPKQFSTWNEGDPAGDLAKALDPNGAQYKQLGGVVDSVMGGKVGDPTGGAKQFYNPATASADWTRGRHTPAGFMIGNHKFVGGASSLQPTGPLPAAGGMDAAEAQAFLKTRYVGWDKAGAPVSMMNEDFSRRLAGFEKANPGVTQYSGYRDNALQGRLFDAAVKKYGSPEAARKWVAPPGLSQHNDVNGMGAMAADLRFASPEARAQAHDSASQFGLEFPMGHEPWHIQPMKGWKGPGGNLQDAAQPPPDFAAIDKATLSLQKVAQASTGLATAAQPVPPALSAGADAFKDLGSSLSSSLGGIGGAIGAKSGNGALGSGIGSILGMILGLFKFRDGGIMGPGGRMPLRQYKDGGVANSPQMAIFAEGSVPEAYIPLKGGGIPVKFAGPAGGVARKPMPAAAQQQRGGVSQMNVTHEVKMAIDLSGANGDAAIEEAARRGANNGAAMAYARVYQDLPRKLQAAAAEGKARY